MNSVVSIMTITYNHAPFIRDCIQGVLMQKTSFPYEMIIGEDCSTDGTREIVMEYAQKYPEIIKVITSDTNVGVAENATRTSRACRGKYIAMCEGDDYWTDPDKLQKQVDFLEAHPDFVMCFHNTLLTYEDGRPSLLRHLQPWDTCSLEELIVNFNDYSPVVTAGHTSSLVFKNGMLKKVPAGISKSMSGDIPLQILLAQYGKAKFINEVMSVHRVHAGGISATHGGIKFLENRIMMYEGLRQALDPKYTPAVDQVLGMYYIEVGDYFLYRDQFRKAYSYHHQVFGRKLAFIKIGRHILMRIRDSKKIPYFRRMAESLLKRDHYRLERDYKRFSDGASALAIFPKRALHPSRFVRAIFSYAFKIQ